MGPLGGGGGVSLGGGDGDAGGGGVPRGDARWDGGGEGEFDLGEVGDEEAEAEVLEGEVVEGRELRAGEVLGDVRLDGASVGVEPGGADEGEEDEEDVGGDLVEGDGEGEGGADADVGPGSVLPRRKGWETHQGYFHSASPFGCSGMTKSLMVFGDSTMNFVPVYRRAVRAGEKAGSTAMTSGWTSSTMSMTDFMISTNSGPVQGNITLSSTIIRRIA